MDNQNLNTENLAMYTCTSSELSNIKTPTNGLFYHTSDTNEFYFDWNNRRHKLSVFSTSQTSTADDVVKKSELRTWLLENDFVTALSLTDAVEEVIGSDVENILTLQALETYAQNNLLTKAEAETLASPTELIEEVNTLKTNNEQIFSYCQTLTSLITEVRGIANAKISSGDLDTRLNDYITKSIADSLYVSQDDASIYIDNAKLEEKLQNYVKEDQLDAKLNTVKKSFGTLNDYAKKIWVEQYYLKKNDSELKKYLTKSEASKLYADIESVEGDYLKKSEADSKFETKETLQSDYVSKSDINKYFTGVASKDELNQYSKKIWVDQYYMRKSSRSGNMDDYLLISDANNKFMEKFDADAKYILKTEEEKFATKQEVESKYIDATSLTSFLANYLSKVEAENYARKIWVDQYYVRKGELQGIQNAMTLSSSYSTMSELNANKNNINPGFYILSGEDNPTIVVVANGSNGEKKLIQVQGNQIQSEALLYFGGEDVNW